MTPEQFSYWFKGACDVIDGAPTPEQWAIIHKAADDVVGPLKSAEKPRKLSRFPAFPWDIAYRNTTGYPK